jgi:hypothetical protein
MAIARDLKTGEFLDIPDKDVAKYRIPPEKVRETLAAAGMGEGPGGPPGPGGPGGPGSLVLNLNLSELLAHAGAAAGPGPRPGGPQVSPQWWQWHPNHPWWWHPYWGPGYWAAPGVWVHL